MRRGRRYFNILFGKDLWTRNQVAVAKRHLGSEYGGWTICTEHVTAGGIVYSAGVGRDISFDLALIEAFECYIHAFDPTPRSVAWIASQALPERFFFHPYGLSNQDGMCAFFAPDDPGHVSYTAIHDRNDKQPVLLPVQRWATVTKLLGHTHIDILKMDIEGSEYAVIDDLPDAETLPQQILVEFHHQRSGLGLEKTKKAIATLNSLGYKIFHISDTGREYSFVR